jgi:DNA-directed RNA polymerase subunit RPC12/RpoP
MVIQRVNKYSCVKCGTSYERNPPDDIHVVELDKPCDEGDSIPITYECPKCKNKVTKHWDKHHQFVATV